MIREHIGGLIPYARFTRTRHIADGQTFRLWIVWLRCELAVEVGTPWGGA